jgi:hypothetical protein
MRTKEEIELALRSINWAEDRWAVFHQNVDAELVASYELWRDSGFREVWYRGGEEWDYSGVVRHVDYEVMPTYATVGEWADAEYTGKWAATYVSGCGKHWKTYADDISDEYRERLQAELIDCLGLTDEEADEHFNVLYDFLILGDALDGWREVETGDETKEGIDEQ